MKKSLLLLICVLPAFTAASSHHTLSYKLDDIDLDCMGKAGLRLDLQGGCFHNAIDRMEQKIIKSGKMNRKQLTRYLNPYKERCIKEAIMARNVDIPMILLSTVQPMYTAVYWTMFIRFIIN